jgi:uncharacterized membrane protein
VPDWVLITAYWLHMAATVLWIGGLAYFTLILLPVVRSTSLLEKEPSLFESLRKRFNPLAWLSLAVLVITGLMQMTGSPQYQGVLVVGDRWSAALFLKHAAIGLMVILASYQTWILQPDLSRHILALSVKGQHSDARRERLLLTSLRLTRINLVLGLLVLALTSIARTA